MSLNFCPECGGALHSAGAPAPGRGYCDRCRAVRHDYPMIVVTCFVSSGSRLLWMRRALPPKAGCWAIPGGFLEQGETLAEGAARELHEETGVLLPPAQLQLYMTGSITFINQIYIAFRAAVDTEFTLPGEESLDCAFFSRDECPWGEVAYPEVNDAIEQAYSDLEVGEFPLWYTEMTATGYRRRALSVV